jgi:hypothetical protein
LEGGDLFIAWLCAEWLHCQAEIMKRQTIGSAETWESSTLTTTLSEFLSEFDVMEEWIETNSIVGG